MPPGPDARPFPRIAAYYEALISRYGHDPRACDYGRAESQAVKFRVLADVGDLTGRHVLDVGCGFADFAGYLSARYPGVRYSGIDITASMIARGRARHPGLDLRVANILDLPASERYDVVFANGIFYLLGDSGAATMRQMVGRMFEMANQAVAFNSLSAWTPAEAGEFHADPLETLSFCQTLTPRLTLRHDYHQRDFTVYLYRPADDRLD